jgi:hypothetical protein
LLQLPRLIMRLLSWKASKSEVSVGNCSGTGTFSGCCGYSFSNCYFLFFFDFLIETFASSGTWSINHLTLNLWEILVYKIKTRNIWFLFVFDRLLPRLTYIFSIFNHILNVILLSPEEIFWSHIKFSPYFLLRLRKHTINNEKKTLKTILSITK